jgi:hypothetical protein
MMLSVKKIINPIFVLSLVLLGGCFGGRGDREEIPEAPIETATRPGAQSPVEVQTQVVPSAPAIDPIKTLSDRVNLPNLAEVATEAGLLEEIRSLNPKLTPEQTAKWFSFYTLVDSSLALARIKAMQEFNLLLEDPDELLAAITNNNPQKPFKKQADIMDRLIKLTEGNRRSLAQVRDHHLALGVKNFRIPGLEEFKTLLPNMTALSGVVVKQLGINENALFSPTADPSQLADFGMLAMSNGLVPKDIVISHIFSYVGIVDNLPYIITTSFSGSTPVVSLKPFASATAEDFLGLQTKGVSEAYLTRLQTKIDTLQAELATNPDASYRMGIALDLLANARKLPTAGGTVSEPTNVPVLQLPNQQQILNTTPRTLTPQTNTPILNSTSPTPEEGVLLPSSEILQEIEPNSPTPSAPAPTP